MKTGRQAIAATVGAVVTQTLLTVFTQLFPGSEGAYGAPFSVGYSCGFCIVELGSDLITTFLWPAFIANLAITAGVLWLLMRLGGHALVVPLGSVVFLIISAAMYFALPVWVPFAGIPLPIATGTHEFPRVGLLALWVDCVVGAALFAVPHVLRRWTGSGASSAFVH